MSRRSKRIRAAVRASVAGAPAPICSTKELRRAARVLMAKAVRRGAIPNQLIEAAMGLPIKGQ